VLREGQTGVGCAFGECAALNAYRQEQHGGCRMLYHVPVPDDVARAAPPTPTPQPDPVSVVHLSVYTVDEAGSVSWMVFWQLGVCHPEVE
jgi:hypothetical protein